eukprot:2690133-Amphidinium_carterae.1
MMKQTRTKYDFQQVLSGFWPRRAFKQTSCKDQLEVNSKLSRVAQLYAFNYLVSSRDPVAQLKHVLCESQRSLESPAAQKEITDFLNNMS